jgi:hypothetical protein
MQQQIARETKRDSSAMKSLLLLTMVFLPTTAIAVSASPGETQFSPLLRERTCRFERRRFPFMTNVLDLGVLNIPRPSKCPLLIPETN